MEQTLERSVKYYLHRFRDSYFDREDLKYAPSVIWAAAKPDPEKEGWYEWKHGTEYLNFKEVEELYKREGPKLKSERFCSRDLPLLMSTLTDRQQEAIHLRFRYDMVYRRMGEEMGLSADRCRQLVVSALDKMRNQARKHQNHEAFK